MRLGVGEVLVSSARMCGRRALPFMLIGLFTYVPAAVYTQHAMDRVFFWNGGGLFLVLLIVPLHGVCWAFMAAAVAFGSDRELHQQPVTTLACAAAAAARIPSILGFVLLLMLCSFGLSLVTLWIPMAGSVLWLVGMVALLVPWYLAVPVLAIEKRGPGGSVSRSTELTRGARWPILGQVFCVIALSVGMHIVLRLVLDVVAPLSGEPRPLMQSGFSGIVRLVALNGLLLAIGIYQAAVQAMTYQGIRQQREGLTSQDVGAVFE